MKKEKNKQVVNEKPNDVNNDFRFASYTKMTAPYHNFLNQEFNSMFYSIRYFQKKGYVVGHSSYWGQYTDQHDKKMIIDYLYNYIEHNDVDKFEPNYQKPIRTEAGNVNTILKSYNIFQGCVWPIKIQPKFISKIGNYTYNQIIYVLGFVLALGDGIFLSRQKLDKNDIYGYASPVNIKCFPYNRFFTVKIHKERNILLSVGVQKYPIYQHGELIRHQYRNYLLFWDILANNVVEDLVKITDQVERCIIVLKRDPARQDLSQQLQIDTLKKKRLNTRYFFYVEKNDSGDEIGWVFQNKFILNCDERYIPLSFKPKVYRSLEGLEYDSSIHRWVEKGYKQKIQEIKFNAYQRKVNEEMVKRFVDFESAKALVELLTKIPNFRIKLTQQEKSVIGQNGNVVVIGRSGTGKTTCAILRLFSIEMLFKIRINLYKRKFFSEIKDTSIGANQIDSTLGLHCVFLTASPVLTNQIQRYYQKITSNIKEELQKKKKRVEQEKLNKKIEEDKSNTKELIKQDDQSFEDLNSMSKDASKFEDLKEENNQDGNMQLDEQQNEIIPQQLKKGKSKEVIQEQAEISKQFQGLQINEKINFNQEAQQQELQEENFEEKMSKFNSLHDLKENDYPGFFTVKSFIMLIDGTLASPFFKRNKNNKILEEDSKASWHNQRKGVMKIQNYFKNQKKGSTENEEQLSKKIQEQVQYQDEEQLQNEYLKQVRMKLDTNKQDLTKKFNEKKKKQIGFQVDYQYFVTYFWPTAAKAVYGFKHLNAHLVWTQIYSTIKGSANAHKNIYSRYLYQDAYLKQCKNKFLSQSYKQKIYQIFHMYQDWKRNRGGYDIMDAVNYILFHIYYYKYRGPEIHYVMIDQIQDLPNAIILLLSQVAQYGVFYSGDTAQTIAKGVGFRFVDLKKLFNVKNQQRPNFSFTGKEVSIPIVKQLTINFRSHNNILQLANTLVSTIEVLFPNTIDKLQKETSDLDGPKPVILSDGSQDFLFKFLSGQVNSKTQITENTQTGFKKPQLQFGCDQVILVKNQASKQKIPSMLQHALCLTIYEAKGLQFNDVILFNFFTDSQCKDKWHIMKSLKAISHKYTKKEFDQIKTKRTNYNLNDQKQVKTLDEQIMKQALEEKKSENKQQQEIIDIQNLIQEKNETVVVKRIVKKEKMSIIDNLLDFSDLNSQLKILYTAITRPRQNLIIYDQDPQCRKFLQELWQQMGVVNVIGKKKNQNKMNEIENIQDQIQLPSLKSLISQSSRDQWKKQGFKMYSRGYYEQAKICFSKSGNRDLELKANANWLADKASKKLIEIQAQRNAIKNNFFIYQQMRGKQIKQIKNKLKDQEKLAFSNFIDAGKCFEELKLLNQAGKCYFSGKDYQNAQKCFVESKMYKQAGQCLQMRNKFMEAVEYYQQAGDYLKVIECLDLLNQWQQILQKIHKFSDKMTEVEKNVFLRKYAALALQDLVYNIQFENEQGNQNISSKRQKKNPKLIQIIKQQQQSQQQQEEEQEEQEELEQNQESQIKQEGEPEILTQENLKEQAQQINQIAESKQLQEVSESFADLNEKQDQNQIKKQKQKQKDSQKSKILQDKSQIKSVQQKQQVIQQHPKDLSSVQSSFSNLNEKLQQNQKSQSSFSDLNVEYPQDQLLPQIQSIKSMVDVNDQWIKSVFSESQIQKNSYSQSEYSIIDQKENFADNIKIIKTKGNIFVQDEVMDKIVKIVSFVNNDAKDFFKQFKGHQSLITQAKEKKLLKKQNQNQPQISEFDQIDPEFINIILDTLESFKLYKLCLFVCNRYFLPAKVARYLLSIAVKYSTNCQLVNKLTASLLLPGIHRKTQIQKGIIASIALHSIYQNVNPDFLKVKVPQSNIINKLSNKQNSQRGNLGCYFINGLILLGLPKKTIFIINPQQALTILFNFFEYNTFIQIFKQKIQNQKEKLIVSSFFLNHPPCSQEQLKFTKISLQKIYLEYNYLNNLPFVSKKKLKQQGLTQMHNYLSNIKIPDYLPYTQALFKSDQAFIKYFQAHSQNAVRILEQGLQHQVYDVTYCIMLCLNKFTLQTLIVKRFSVQIFMKLYKCIEILKISMNKFFGKNAFTIIQAVFSIYKCRIIKPCKSLSFINQGFAFIDKSSNLLNHFIQLQKQVNQNNLTYFFEQDFNLILVKVTQALKQIKKKLSLNLIRFWKQKIQQKVYSKNTLRQDYIENNCQLLLNFALTFEIQKMTNMNQQTKKILEKKKDKRKLNQQQKQQKFLASNVPYDLHDLRYQGMELISSDSQDQQNILNKMNDVNDSLLKPIAIFNQYMTPIRNTLIQMFTLKIKKQKKIAYGKFLFASGNNFFYRQYTQKFGGYHLYDAMQFKRFKRLDLYADNVLSILDDIPVKQRYVYINEILFLLMIQLKAKTEGNNFELRVHKKFFKHLQGLRAKQIVYLNKFNKIQSKIDKPSKHQILEVLGKQANFKTYCIFTYHFLYTSSLNSKQLEQLIRDYFDLALAEEEYSKFLELKLITLQYLINIAPPMKILYQKLRSVVNRNQFEWKKDQSFVSLFDTKNHEAFELKRNFEFMEDYKRSSNEIFHQVKVANKGNLNAAIEQSQKKYEIQGKLIDIRRKAALKISAWWKNIQIAKQNYFIKKGRRKTVKPDRLCQTRLVRNVYNANVPYEFKQCILTKSSESRDQLLEFYLQNQITNALDFHFILLTLNKIQEIRSNYINLYAIKKKKKYVAKGQQQQQDISQRTNLLEISDTLAQCCRSIEHWKKDNKWMRIKNIQLKHKKAFQLKWMSKNIISGKKKKKLSKNIPKLKIVEQS